MATIYIGNFPYTTTEKDLRDLLTGRNIKRVNIVMDKEAGRPKGFGFVELESEKDARDAVRDFNGTDFGGRRLKVDMAKEDRRGAQKRR